MPAKILVVDDDQDIFDFLSVVLKLEGYETVWAQNSSEFQKHAFKQQPQLIILDIMLGEENGPEVYRRMLLKGLPETTPVIFLSALAEGSSQFEPGHRYALHAKPVDQDRLLRDIRVMLDAA